MLDIDRRSNRVIETFTPQRRYSSEVSQQNHRLRHCVLASKQHPQPYHKALIVFPGILITQVGGAHKAIFGSFHASYHSSMRSRAGYDP